MQQRHVNPGQQVTQGGCIRLLGYLLLALGVIAGLLVIASFGKTLGGGNNSPQQLTTLDDVQQYVFDTMAKPVQDYRLKHPTYGRNLGMGQIGSSIQMDRPSTPSPRRLSPVRTEGIWIRMPIIANENFMMQGDSSP